MHYEVRLTRSELVHTAVILDRVPPKELSRFVPAACGEVWKYVRAAGLQRPGRHMALYLNREGTVEVGAEVSKPFEGNGRIHCSHLPAGETATTVHFGPYAQLSEAHNAVREWCEENGYLPEVCWELYGHWEEAWNKDPSKIRTDVFYLLKPKT
jgi:effector-binding domain-containing protein